MKPGETAAQRRRGCNNSQAKGPASDETLESNDAPKKQFATAENLSGLITEAQIP